MKIFKYVILGAILMALFACENEKNTFSDNPSIYIGGDKEQNATADSVIFSFKKYDDAVQSYDLNLMVYVTGVVSDRALTFCFRSVGGRNECFFQRLHVGRYGDSGRSLLCDVTRYGET